MSMLKPHQTNALELNNRNLISEIRVLKVPLLIVLILGTSSPRCQMSLNVNLAIRGIKIERAETIY